MPEPIEVRIEKLVYGGEGLARHEGHTVFVPLVLPGETVQIEPVEQHKKFIRGRVRAIVTASPERSQPPCPHFGQCGGCDYSTSLMTLNCVTRPTSCANRWHD